jgi:hypothetical protein
MDVPIDNMFNHESPRRGYEFVTRKITAGVGRILAGRSIGQIIGPARTVWMLLVWAIWLGTLSFLPSGMKGQLGTRGALHFPVHFLVFAVPTFIVLLLNKGLSQRLLGCGAVFCYALAIEAGQSMYYNAPVEWNDVGIDTLAVVLILSASFLAPSRRGLTGANQHM